MAKIKHTIHLRSGAEITFKADNFKWTHKGDEVLSWEIVGGQFPAPVYLRIDDIVAIVRHA